MSNDPPKIIKCGECGHVAYRDGVLRAKVMNLTTGRVKCRNCGQWFTLAPKQGIILDVNVG